MYTTNEKQNWCFDDIRIKPKYSRLLWPFQLFLHFVFPLKLYRFAQSNAQGSFAAQCDTLLAYILFLPSYRSLSPPLTVCQEPFFLGFSTFRKKKVFAEGEIVIYFQRQKKKLSDMALALLYLSPPSFSRAWFSTHLCSLHHCALSSPSSDPSFFPSVLRVGGTVKPRWMNLLNRVGWWSKGWILLNNVLQPGKVKQNVMDVAKTCATNASLANNIHSVYAYTVCICTVG